jgi:hypothetical protein
MGKKPMKFRAMKYDGDDPYSWAVFKAEDIKGLRGSVPYGYAKPVVSGLTIDIARYEARKLHKEELLWEGKSYADVSDVQKSVQDA